LITLHNLRLETNGTILKEVVKKVNKYLRK